MQANGTAATERTLDLDIHDVTLDEIALAAGWRKIGIDTDMPMSLKLHLGLAPDGSIGATHGRFVFGSGFLRLDDPDHEPVFVDGLPAAFCGRRESIASSSSPYSSSPARRISQCQAKSRPAPRRTSPGALRSG